MLHRQPFDFVSLRQHGVLPPEVDIGRRHVVKRFVIALVVVVRDEVAKRSLELPREAARQEDNWFFDQSAADDEP